MNKLRLNSMTTLRRNSSKRLRLILAGTRRLISANRRRLVTNAVGAIIGAVVGGVISGLDYAALIADLHHRHEIDAFAFNYLDYLFADVIAGAIIGVVCGLIGVFLGAFKSPGARKTVMRIAGGAVIVGVAACVALIVLAAYGIAVRGSIGPQGAITPGDFLIGPCSYAAGLIIGAVRTGD